MAYAACVGDGLTFCGGHGQPNFGPNRQRSGLSTRVNRVPGRRVNSGHLRTESVSDLTEGVSDLTESVSDLESDATLVSVEKSEGIRRDLNAEKNSVLAPVVRNRGRSRWSSRRSRWRG